MRPRYCRHHLAPVPAGDLIERDGDVIVVTDQEGMMMIHHIDDRPNPPIHRLRRRDLVAAIAARTELDLDEADDFIEAIEQAVIDAAMHDHRFADLPRAGSIGCHPDGPWILTTYFARVVPLVQFSEDIATRAGVSIDDAELALAITTKMVEAAPADAAVYVPGWGYHGPDEALTRLGHEARAELLDEYRTQSGNVWLLLCNPEKYDVFAAIDTYAELPATWSVSRYRNDIAVGDPC